MNEYIKRIAVLIYAHTKKNVEGGEVARGRGRREYDVINQKLMKLKLINA